MFGTIAVGLFAANDGLFFGGGTSLLVTQITGVLVICVFAFVVTHIIMTILKKTIGIRVSESEEILGIDAVTFGVDAYSNS